MWQVRRKIRGASGLYKEGHKLLTWSGCKELALSTPANQLSFAVKPHTEVHLLHTAPHKVRDLIPDDYIFRNLWPGFFFFLLCLTVKNLSFNGYMNIATSSLTANTWQRVKWFLKSILLCRSIKMSGGEITNSYFHCFGEVFYKQRKWHRILGTNTQNVRSCKAYRNVPLLASGTEC